MTEPKPTALWIKPLRDWIKSMRNPNICPQLPANRAREGVLDALEAYIDRAESGHE